MPTTLESVVKKYLRSGSPPQRTREEYATILRRWSRWGGAVPLERLGRKEIREFLDWVHEDAVSRQATNPGRTANKVRSNLRAVLSWAWEHDLVDALPRFPRLKPQRDVAGRHCLTKPELNSLYFATHSAGGITYRHYAHRAPLAFRANLSLPQPSAFKAIARGFEGRCPCCRRKFTEAEARITARKCLRTSTVGLPFAQPASIPLLTLSTRRLNQQ